MFVAWCHYDVDEQRNIFVRHVGSIHILAELNYDDNNTQCSLSGNVYFKLHSFFDLMPFNKEQYCSLNLPV